MFAALLNFVMGSIKEFLVLIAAVLVPVSTPPDLNAKLTGTIQYHLGKVRPHLRLMPVFVLEWVWVDIDRVGWVAVVFAGWPWGFALSGPHCSVLLCLASMATLHREIHPSDRQAHNLLQTEIDGRQAINGALREFRHQAQPDVLRRKNGKGWLHDIQTV